MQQSQFSLTDLYNWLPSVFGDFNELYRFLVKVVNTLESCLATQSIQPDSWGELLQAEPASAKTISYDMLAPKMVRLPHNCASFKFSDSHGELFNVLPAVFQRLHRGESVLSLGDNLGGVTISEPGRPLLASVILFKLILEFKNFTWILGNHDLDDVANGLHRELFKKVATSIFTELAEIAQLFGHNLMNAKRLELRPDVVPFIDLFYRAVKLLPMVVLKFDIRRVMHLSFITHASLPSMRRTPREYLLEMEKVSNSYDLVTTHNYGFDVQLFDRYPAMLREGLLLEDQQPLEVSAIHGHDHGTIATKIPGSAADLNSGISVRTRLLPNVACMYSSYVQTPIPNAVWEDPANAALLPFLQERKLVIQDGDNSFVVPTALSLAASYSDVTHDVGIHRLLPPEFGMRVFKDDMLREPLVLAINEIMVACKELTWQEWRQIENILNLVLPDRMVETTKIDESTGKKMVVSKIKAVHFSDVLALLNNFAALRITSLAQQRVLSEIIGYLMNVLHQGSDALQTNIVDLSKKDIFSTEDYKIFARWLEHISHFFVAQDMHWSLSICEVIDRIMAKTEWLRSISPDLAQTVGFCNYCRQLLNLSDAQMAYKFMTIMIMANRMARDAAPLPPEFYNVQLTMALQAHAIAATDYPKLVMLAETVFHVDGNYGLARALAEKLIAVGKDGKHDVAYAAYGHYLLSNIAEAARDDALCAQQQLECRKLIDHNWKQASALNAYVSAMLYERGLIAYGETKPDMVTANKLYRFAIGRGYLPAMHKYYLATVFNEAAFAVADKQFAQKCEQLAAQNGYIPAVVKMAKNMVNESNAAKSPGEKLRCLELVIDYIKRAACTCELVDGRSILLLYANLQEQKTAMQKAQIDVATSVAPVVGMFGASSVTNVDAAAPAPNRNPDKPDDGCRIA